MSEAGSSQLDDLGKEATVSPRQRKRLQHQPDHLPRRGALAGRRVGHRQRDALHRRHAASERDDTRVSRSFGTPDGNFSGSTAGRDTSARNTPGRL